MNRIECSSKSSLCCQEHFPAVSSFIHIDNPERVLKIMKLRRHDKITRILERTKFGRSSLDYTEFRVLLSVRLSGPECGRIGTLELA
jgi:hypothetical protein